MDGYTFMLARNQLLIDWERARELPKAPSQEHGTEEEAGERDRRTRLVELYRRLEGCGR
jgi:hypothetical protein